MRILFLLLAATLIAAPSSAGSKRGARKAATVAPGVYTGYTYDSYLVFEVREDGSIDGTIEHFDYPGWPPSYLKAHLLWGAVEGYVGRKGAILNLEWHYDFPDEDDYYLDEDQFETISVQPGTDANGNPTLIYNAGWGTKFIFTREP